MQYACCFKLGKYFYYYNPVGFVPLIRSQPFEVSRLTEALYYIECPVTRGLSRLTEIPAYQVPAHPKYTVYGVT